MASIQIQTDAQQLAVTAAALTAQNLNAAIARWGSASWVLAGGTAPLMAYQVLAQDYREQIDWTQVTVILGDERCGPTDHPDSNWRQISEVFLDQMPIPTTNKLRPDYELSAETAAASYAKRLVSLPKTETDQPRLDEVWLGLGEDGHTLSLFPGQMTLQAEGDLVVAVHNSPKPPPDRLSLTLLALRGVSNCLILAAGAGKAKVIARAQAGDTSLPIVQAINVIESHGGQVIWLLDRAAASVL